MKEGIPENKKEGGAEEKRKLRKILLKLACELKRVCEKYGLSYFLHAGSLLGAVRHGGFIPWDDDMDFVLPRRDFERLIGIAETEIRAPYFLQTDRNTPSMVTFGRIRLRMDGTTGVQLPKEIRETYHQGLAIDIAPLDFTGNGKERDRAWKRQDRFAALHYAKHFPVGNERLAQLGAARYGKRLLQAGGALCPDRYLVRKLREAVVAGEGLSEFRAGEECTISSECGGVYRHIVLRQDWYRDRVIMPFEEETFPVPAGYREILSAYYGSSYMEIPPEEHSKGHHFPVMSTDRPYMEVLKPFNGLFKDVKGKTIVVFGAGKMLEHYLKHTKRKYHPAFVVDNDPDKWGKTLYGIRVETPQKLTALPGQKRYVVICSIYYKEIIKQLEALGVTNYYIYVQDANWL